MQDAIILANCLYDLKSLSQNHIEAALNDYKEQRYGPVKTQFDQSMLNAIILNGQVKTLLPGHMISTINHQY